MLYNIFSDPHLGVTRKAHTTAKSSERLTQALYEAAESAVGHPGKTIIAGDLFDKTYNPEYIIQQGIKIADGAIILAGNHDETNRASARSSIDIVAMNADVVQCAVGETSITEVRGAKFNITLVPHHSTQELFLAALDKAINATEGDKFNYLFVHCNRGELPGPQADSTLVITIERERELLEVFDRILYGHIHQPAMYDGKQRKTEHPDEAKVIVCGNTHPTSFGDISNKFGYTFNATENMLDPYWLWSVQQGYREIEVGGNIPDLKGVQFVKVYGKGNKLDVANFVQSVWDSGTDLLAVRPDVEFTDLDVTEVEDVNLENLADVIANELKETDLAEAFAELLGELK
jgi:DNA repair exonuclease SbcCD nuclease subunit